MALRIASQGPPQLQNTYQQAIEGVLANVRHTRTGTVVITHVEHSPQMVTIEPFTDQGHNAEARPESEAASGTLSPGRVAHGTNSRVRFSVERSTLPATWPQGTPDEVLVHELAHALRQINGAEQYTGHIGALQAIATFGNVEEFFAVMVASVYSSELRRPLLGNHGQLPLRNPAMLQNPPYSTRLRQAWTRMPAFVAEIAAIPAAVAAFNPFRDVPH